MDLDKNGETVTCLVRITTDCFEVLFSEYSTLTQASITFQQMKSMPIMPMDSQSYV